MAKFMVAILFRRIPLLCSLIIMGRIKINGLLKNQQPVIFR